MGLFASLLVATPLFGFALTPPQASLSPAMLFASPAVELAMSQDAGRGSASTANQDAGAEAAAEVEAGSAEEDAYVDALKQRSSIAKAHRILGISTWASMGVTLLLGGIQFHNLYGAFDDQASNPCVTGNAIFGQSQCSGTPWAHLSSVILTSALYTATFTLSLMMPDPDNAGEGDGEFAKNLRMHKVLRWVHFGGMMAQMILGAVVANADSFGLDRANDYGTLQALAAVHMGVGFVTYGALTWAGALMVF